MVPIRKKIKNTIIYWFIIYLFLFVRLVSRPTALLVFGKLGHLAFYLLGWERQKTIRHLTMAYGKEINQRQIKNMAKQVFRDLGKNVVDAIRLPLINRDNLHHVVRFEGIENIEKSLKKGKGAVFFTGHIGCWELMAAAVAMIGYPVFVIGAPIYDPRLDRMLVRNRENAGYRNIARGDSIKKILRALRSNSILGILIDLDTRFEGVFVDFFGHPAHTTVTPVALALKSGAAVVPIVIQLMDDYKHRILIKEPVELMRSGDRQKDLFVNTQKLTRFLEEMIRLHPTQWIWMHERWKTKPG